MKRTTVITIRIDPTLKANAEQVLAQLGMTTAQAITIFLKQVESNRGLPFTPRLPPQATHVYKPFKAKTFSLGDEVMPERDELYVERGL